jgi:predicted transcriptional regulator
MKRTTIWLKLIQVRQLRALATETGAPVAALIRKAIDEFIARRKAERPAATDRGFRRTPEGGN